MIPIYGNGEEGDENEAQPQIMKKGWMNMTARKGSIDGEPRTVFKEKKGLEIVKRIPCLYNQKLTDAFVEGLIEKANQMNAIVKKFESVRSSLLWDAELYLDPGRRILMGDPGMDSLAEEIANKFESMKKEISLLYAVLSEGIIPPQVDLFFMSGHIISCFQARSLVFDVSISVAEGDALIVRTPPLVSKQPSWDVVHKNPNRLKHSGWFAQEVEYLFDTARGRIPEFDKRNISVFRVISTKRRVYPDHDNIDTKALIDVISLRTGTFDNPKVVSLSSMAVFNDDLKEGCYFVVSKNYNAPPDEKTLLRWIQTATVVTENSAEKMSGT